MHEIVKHLKSTPQNIKFSIKVLFTEEIPNGKLYFLWSEFLQGSFWFQSFWENPLQRRV